MSESVPLSREQLAHLGRTIYNALAITHGCDVGDCGELNGEWAGPDSEVWIDIATQVVVETKLVPQYTITEMMF